MPKSTAKPRMLVIGCEPPLQTFLYRLFAGLEDEIHVMLASRRPFTGPASRFERLPMPQETWPRPVRAAATLAYGANALRHAAGRRLLAFDGWRRLPAIQRPVDLIYMPWNATAASHLPLLQIGVPSLLSCRGSHVNVAPLNPERQALAAALPATFEAATKVHCVSLATQQAAARFGLDESKVSIIRPAVDPAILSPATPPEPPPWRILSVGNLLWLKGFEDALVAIKGLVDRGFDVHFDLVGEGQDRQRLLFTVHDLGLENRVILHGQKSSAEVRERLGMAHIFLLTSLSEGISNAALEAMACGLPVVSTRVGGMPEAITHGEDGLLVPEQNPRAIGMALEQLLTEPELPTRLGMAARKKIESSFSLDNQTRRFVELCHETMRQGNPH